MFAPALAYGGAYGAYGPAAYAGYGYGAFPGAYGLGMWNQKQGQHAPPMHLQNLDEVDMQNDVMVSAAVGAAASYCATNPGKCSAAAHQAAEAAKHAYATAKTAVDKVRASEMAQKAKSLLGNAWSSITSRLTGAQMMELNGLY